MLRERLTLPTDRTLISTTASPFLLNSPLPFSSLRFPSWILRWMKELARFHRLGSPVINCDEVFVWWARSAPSSTPRSLHHLPDLLRFPSPGFAENTPRSPSAIRVTGMLLPSFFCFEQLKTFRSKRIEF